MASSTLNPSQQRQRQDLTPRVDPLVAAGPQLATERHSTVASRSASAEFSLSGFGTEGTGVSGPRYHGHVRATSHARGLTANTSNPSLARDEPMRASGISSRDLELSEPFLPVSQASTSATMGHFQYDRLPSPRSPFSLFSHEAQRFTSRFMKSGNASERFPARRDRLAFEGSVSEGAGSPTWSSRASLSNTPIFPGSSTVVAERGARRHDPHESTQVSCGASVSDSRLHHRDTCLPDPQEVELASRRVSESLRRQQYNTHLPQEAESGGSDEPFDGSEDQMNPMLFVNRGDMIDDFWGSRNSCRTRNLNALHAFSWDQRVFLPTSRGTFSSALRLLASPRFWEKMDWTIRGSVLTILPTLILCLEPATQHIFPLPTSVVALAFWTSQPTFGAGLRETYIVLKGFSISLVVLCIIIAIQPGPAWLSLLLMFCALLSLSFVAEQMRRTVIYTMASFVMQYISKPTTTGYSFVVDYYVTLLIAQGFGLASFFFPYIRWSSDNAKRYIITMGDAISLSIHSACCSFWVQGSALERHLHVARLRQLRHTVEHSKRKAATGLSEMGYEPHSGEYTAQLKSRMSFLTKIFNVVQGMVSVIELIVLDPDRVDTPLCNMFGQRLRGELSLIAATMDAMVLRIVDLDNIVTDEDMSFFAQARERFMGAVSAVREELILNNSNYRTTYSDVLLGSFLFNVEELLVMIGSFQDVADPPSNFSYFLRFPLRDLQSSWTGTQALYRAIVHRHVITRRLKEAIKISACVIIAAFFQVYAMKNSSTSPVAGVDIIALVYRPTGAESFQYSTNRLLGTVLGSLTGLLSVQIAEQRRSVLYICALVLTFVGSYVQAAPNYFPLGNAICNSVISVVVQFQNENSAMTRIQQNCFAILIYFLVASFIWPMRGRTKMQLGLDMSLRMSREAVHRLLNNLDLPESATAVSDDVSTLLEEMQKRIGQQLTHLPGAVVEPTMDSAEFPEMSWRMVIRAQQKLYVALLMMRFAYSNFMTSTIGDSVGGPTDTGVSVHWVVLHRISPHTKQLSRLIYEAMDLYLMIIAKSSFVPTASLTRMRQAMLECYDRIIELYIQTIQHQLNCPPNCGEAEKSNDSDKAQKPAAPESSAKGATSLDGPSGYLTYRVSPEELQHLESFIKNSSFINRFSELTGGATLNQSSANLDRLLNSSIVLQDPTQVLREVHNSHLPSTATPGAGSLAPQVEGSSAEVPEAVSGQRSFPPLSSDAPLSANSVGDSSRLRGRRWSRALVDSSHGNSEAASQIEDLPTPGGGNRGGIGENTHTPQNHTFAGTFFGTVSQSARQFTGLLRQLHQPSSSSSSSAQENGSSEDATDRSSNTGARRDSCKQETAAQGTTETSQGVSGPSSMPSAGLHMNRNASFLCNSIVMPSAATAANPQLASLVANQLGSSFVFPLNNAANRSFIQNGSVMRLPRNGSFFPSYPTAAPLDNADVFTLGRTQRAMLRPPAPWPVDLTRGQRRFSSAHAPTLFPSLPDAQNVVSEGGSNVAAGSEISPGAACEPFGDACSVHEARGSDGTLQRHAGVEGNGQMRRANTAPCSGRPEVSDDAVEGSQGFGMRSFAGPPSHLAVTYTAAELADAMKKLPPAVRKYVEALRNGTPLGSAETFDEQLANHSIIGSCGATAHPSPEAELGDGWERCGSGQGGVDPAGNAIEEGAAEGLPPQLLEEYVLTNEDIHSLEAFLFGLRAIIQHVEDLEKELLEVVHNNEMAKKL